MHVRAGKQKRQREVPLHESTIGALGEYARQRDARFPTPSTSAFFISARGRRMARGRNRPALRANGVVMNRCARDTAAHRRARRGVGAVAPAMHMAAGSANRLAVAS